MPDFIKTHLNSLSIDQLDELLDWLDANPSRYCDEAIEVWKVKQQMKKPEPEYPFPC